MSSILVLDVGTSSLKAVLFSPDGEVIDTAEEGYGPSPAPHRQNQQAWWTAAAAACRRIEGPQPTALALTGTMENLIAVDAAGMPAGPAILYSDPCGTSILAATADRLAEAGAGSILGNAPEPLMTVFKLGWLSQAEPQTLAAARWILGSPKDALALRMTGVASTDPVTASTSGLMDMARRDWSPALVAATGTDPRRLPSIRPASALLGPLLPPAATALGLPAGIPVFNGCGDAGATTAGSGCDHDGDISLHIGTTGWVARVVDDRGIREPRPVYRLAHPDDGLVIEVTPILSAGSATAWARSVLGLDAEVAEAALAASEEVPPDLVFLPYLSGERSPFEDTAVRGAFVGLDAGHGAPALYRAVVEGVSFAIRASLAALDQRPGLRIRLVGGGATSAHWPGILADVLQRPVERVADPAAATARGAFAVAARALGMAGGTVRSVETVTPRPGSAARIDRLAAVFDEATAFARATAHRFGG